MATHLGTTQKSTTVGNLVFLLLSFPFGLLYFLVVVIGFAVGLSTLILWIGIPILFATVVIIQGMAAIEREMVIRLLRIPFPHRRHRYSESGGTFTQRFGNYLRDPLTWTSTIYMVLKLPLGIISFTLALVLPIVAIVVTLLPLVYLVNLFVNAILLANGIHSTAYIIPYFIVVNGHFDLVMFARSFIGTPVGLILWFVARSLLKGLALLSGELAYALLSPSEAPMMAEAQQLYVPPESQEGLQISAALEKRPY